MNELRIEFGVQKWKCLNFRRSTYLREKQTCIWSTRDFFLFCFLAVVINNRVRAWANDAKNVICCKHLVGNKNETWKMQENSKQSIVKAWRGSEASEMGRLSMYIGYKCYFSNRSSFIHMWIYILQIAQKLCLPRSAFSAACFSMGKFRNLQSSNTFNLILQLYLLISKRLYEWVIVICTAVIIFFKFFRNYEVIFHTSTISSKSIKRQWESADKNRLFGAFNFRREQHSNT